jgi:hypothetical protein
MKRFHVPAFIDKRLVDLLFIFCIYVYTCAVFENLVRRNRNQVATPIPIISWIVTRIVLTVLTSEDHELINQ